MPKLTKLNGSSLNSAIVDILHARGTASPASAWKVSKRPWMRLVSNSSATMEIWNGSENWTVEGMHELSGRIVPKPSLTGIKVSSEGTMATMRKVTVSFDLYSPEQLIQAQKAFFVPGMSCIASWGWNIQTDGTPITHCPTSFAAGSGMAGATAAMNGWITENNYAVDGTFGLISDFQWTYKGGSNSYGASITITAPARNYLSTGIKGGTKGPCGCKKSDGEDTDASENTNGSCVIQNLRDNAKEKIKDGEAWTDPDGNFAGAGITMDTAAPEDASMLTSLLQDWSIIGGDVKYVTWDYFESYVITSCLSPGSDDYKNETPAEGMQANSAIFGSKIWRMDSEGTKLNIPSTAEVFFSTDPGVCLLPGYYHWDQMDGDGDNDVKNVEGLPKGKVKYLKEVLLNIEFLLKSAEESETVDEYMMKVANKVADVCGGCWDFVLGADPEDPSIIRVINKRAMETPVSVPEITLLGVNSSARDWGMDTDIPADVKHSIMLGSNQQASSGTNGDDDQVVWQLYGADITDNMYAKLKMPDACVGAEKSDADCPKPKVAEPALKELKKAAGSLADYADEDSVAAARGALRAYLDEVTPKTKTGGGGQTVMPIGFSGTFDGIGGIQWGENFRVKEIGSSLIEYAAFSVKTISQDVSIGDWTTSLETQLML